MTKHHRTARIPEPSITRTRAGATFLVAVTVLCLIGGTDALAQGTCVEQKLLADPGTVSMLVGAFTAIDGDTAVFSAFFTDQASGSAWIYERDGSGTWNFSKAITRPLPDDPSLWRMAIDGDTLAVGVADNGPGGGVVHIFERNLGGPENWGWVKTFREGIKLDNEFGISVALQGDTLVVGAHRDTGHTERSGAVYVFDRNQGGAENWGLIQTISPPGFIDGAEVGREVALDGGAIAIGAPGADGGTGRILCRTTSNLVLGDPLGVPAPGGQFGRSVGISGSTVVGSSLTGAYRIDSTCGTPAVPLTLPSAADSTGSPIDIVNDRIAVRGDAVSGFGTPTPAIFVLERNQGGANAWGLESRTYACDPAAGVTYGSDVSIDDTSGVVRLLAGAVSADGQFAQQGAVLVPEVGVCGDGIVDPFEECDDGDLLDGPPCDSNCTATACGNGIVTGSEECDDGNLVPEDGCSDTCVSEYCGDGIVQGGLGEECEPPEPDCSSACKLEYCGNNIVDPGEQCDDGLNGNGDGCDDNCTFTACGNGILTPSTGEVCDDGNTDNYDGCGPDCTSRTCIGTLSGIEAWWTGDSCGPQDFQEMHDGAYVGFPYCPSTPPKVGANSMPFDGPTGTYFIVPHDPELEPGTGAFAVDMWLYPTTESLAGFVPLLSKQSAWSLYLFDGKLRFSFNATAALYLVHPDGLIPDQWNFVAASMSAGSTTIVRLSVNGNTTEGSIAGRLDSSSPYDLYVGSSSAPLSRTFDGLMDELEIFSEELSIGEIQLLYEVGSLGKCKFPIVGPPENLIDAPTLGEWGLALLSGGLLLSGALLLRWRGGA